MPDTRIITQNTLCTYIFHFQYERTLDVDIVTRVPRLPWLLGCQGVAMVTKVPRCCHGYHSAKVLPWLPQCQGVAMVTRVPGKQKYYPVCQRDTERLNFAC